MPILRTNYRLTGRYMDIDAIGGAVPLSSAFGAAGTDLPYGGFMYFSWAGTIQDQTAGVTANQSYGVVISTYGAMSAFYGDGKFNSGYKFLPINARIISLTDTAFSHAASPSHFPVICSIVNSGSYAFIKILGFSQGASASVGWLATLATIAGELKLFVYGFIVSSP